MPRYKNHKKTKKYSNEFKVKAVQLTLFDDVMIREVAESLGIHPFMLSRWRKEYREGKIKVDKRKKTIQQAQSKSDNPRIRELENQVAKLQTENEILKKWQRFLAEQRQNGSSS